MAEILLFHHAQGLTPGIRAFADDLRAAGHTVHTPDLYDGATFDDLDAGVAHMESIGPTTIIERGTAIAADLTDELVYAGFSMGAMPAQSLAQQRPGARGAVLLHSAIPLRYFGGAWPDGVPLQIHTLENDDWGDLDVAQEVAAAVPGAELFVYPGDQHLVTDRSLPVYDPAVAGQVTQRVLDFLAAV